MPYPSCLGCSSQSSSQTDSHEETHKHEHHYGLGGLQPPNGVAITAIASTPDLYTQLALLTRDHREAQKENTQNKAIIEYLLTSKILESKVEKEVVELHKEISSLKQKLVEHTKDGQQLRIDLRKALDTISVLAARTTVTTTSLLNSALNEDDSKVNNTAAINSPDLIDFSDHLGGTAHAAPASGGTTLLNDEDDDDYMSDSADDVKTYAHTQSATISFSEELDFEDSPYIHHFINEDGATKSHRGRKLVATVLLFLILNNLQLILAFQINEQSGNFEQHTASLAALKGSTEASGSSEGYISTLSERASPSASFGASSNAKSVSFTSGLAGSKGTSGGDISLWQNYAAYSAGDEGSSRLPTPHRTEKSALPASSLFKALEEPKHVASTEPRWSRSTFFEIDRELSGALLINQRTAGLDDLRHPDFFKYGLRFAPSRNQRNVYRTVTISGIPANITMRMILDGVRGGVVLESSLLNTLKVTGSNTALIIFLHEHSALAYEEHAKKHPIMFSGLVAKVTVVPTPTWPIKPKLRKAVFDHQHSRCLEVHNFPRSISPSGLRKDIGHCEELKLNHLIHMEMRKDGTLLLQFSSIDGAGWAYGMLSSFRAYRDCEPFFTPDPCSQSLETLHPLTKIDSNVAKVVSANEEQKGQNPADNCPSPTTEISFSVSSDGISSSELIASKEP